jgi:uncharacterized membrane protein
VEYLKLGFLALAVLAIASYIWRFNRALQVAGPSESQRFTTEARFPWWGTALLAIAFAGLFAAPGILLKVFVALGIVIWVIAGTVWQHRRMQALGFAPAFCRCMLQAALLGGLGTSLLLAWIILPF